MTSLNAAGVTQTDVSSDCVSIVDSLQQQQWPAAHTLCFAVQLAHPQHHANHTQVTYQTNLSSALPARQFRDILGRKVGVS